jgi:U3 small nucleolar RNA-associated protein 21
MAVASADGQLSVWDLEGRRLWQLVPVAHSGGIASAYFLPGQPMLLTAGSTDNALKVWLVEGEEVRLLKGRSGHSAPPQLVRFHEEDGFGLLSGGGPGDKSVRYTSLLKDSQCHELSQGSIEAKARRMREQDGRAGWVDPAALKLPPVTGLAYFGRKDLKWDNLVTCHEGLNFARTWRAAHKVIGAHKLKSSDGAAVTAVAMSSCGNFALIGSGMGTVDVYNMQSGLLRKTIPGEAEPSPVRGLAVDAVNKEGLAVYASGRLVVFDFATGPKAAKVLCVKEALASLVTAFAFNPDNGLAAVAVDAGRVLVVDLAARRIVRHFSSSAMALIRDLAFSPDGKSLVSGDARGFICTWDLPSGLLVDAFRAPSPVLSLACSPTGQFIASSHEGDRAVHLWSSTGDAIGAPMQQAGLSLGEGLADRNLDRELIRLSSQPRSKWTQLLHLDSIKARNRVLQAEKAPERAPFFLDAAVLKDAATEDQRKRDSEGKPVREDRERAEAQLPLEALLGGYMKHRSTGPVVDYLRDAGNASISFGVHALSAEMLPAMLGLLLALLQSHQHYEMVQTLLGLTLRAHRDELMGCAESRMLVAELEAVQRGLWEDRLEPLLQKALCLTAFCKDRF